MSCNRTFNVLEMPQKIWLGRKGEMNFRPVSFEWDVWHNEHPGATLSVIYTSQNKDIAPLVVATGTSTPVIWQPTTDVSTVSGYGSVECHLIDGDEIIGISAAAITIIDNSASSTTATEPSWVDQVVQDVAAEADRAEAAVESIGTQVDEAVAEAVPIAVAEYIEEHPIEVEETDPTVPSWAKQPTKPTYTAQEVGALPSSYTPPVVSVNGKTGAVTLGAADVHALPDSTVIPAEVTEQTVSGWGFTKNTGTYSKPSGGIPKTDLAADVQTSLGKADTALQTAPVASVNNKTGAVVLKTSDLQNDSGFQTAPFEIPITQSGSTYTTTASAADILANADNCVAVLQGTKLTLDFSFVNGNNATLMFGATTLDTQYPEVTNIFVSVSNGTVTVTMGSTDIKPLPTVTASDNGKSLVVENGAWGKGYQAARTPRVAMASTDTTPTLDPNKLYVFPEMASLAPTLAAPSDSTIVNEYHFLFTSGATAATLTIPAAVLQPDGFSVEANHVYEVSIAENCMTAQGWAVSAE